MYTPPAFRVVDMADLHREMREARSATLITALHEGLIGAMLPVVLDESEGSMGTIYARLARSNPQRKLTPTGEAMAIFAGAQAYINPSWYLIKHDTGEPYRRGTMSQCMPTVQLSSSMMPIG
ncbi:putative FMN-binding regulatory protein PaiB [Bradyrhizobium sp. i1.3.1]